MSRKLITAGLSALVVGIGLLSAAPASANDFRFGAEEEDIVRTQFPQPLRSDDDDMRPRYERRDWDDDRDRWERHEDWRRREWRRERWRQREAWRAQRFYGGRDDCVTRINRYWDGFGWVSRRKTFCR